MNVLEQAREIARRKYQNYQEKNDNFEQVETILLEHLKTHAKDTDAWLLLTRIECNAPLYDYDRIAHYIGHVLSYDPTNAYALLFLAYADYYLHGQIDADTYTRLCLAKNDNSEIMAMIEVAKARYFESFNEKKYQEALEKSVHYSLKQRINCSNLGILYFNQGKIQEGKDLIQQALKNVKEVFPSDNVTYDPTSIEGLLDEFYAGTIISEGAYAHLKSIVAE